MLQKPKEQKKRKPNKKRIENMLDHAWSEFVHKRDKFCQKCGGRGGLQAHHAFGRRNTATRWDVENGVLLCHPHHHYWAHRDSAGFAWWFANKIGEAQYMRLAEAHVQIYKPSIDELSQKLNALNEMIGQL